MNEIGAEQTYFKKYRLIIALTILLAIAAGFLNIYLPWYVFLGSLILFVSAALIFRNPVWGVFFITFFLPFERLGAYEFGATTIRLSQIFLIITIAAWFFGLIIGRRYTYAKNPALLPLILFLTIGLIALPQTLNLDRSLTVFFYIIFTALLAFVLPNLIRTKIQLQQVILVLFCSFILVSIFGLWQFAGDMNGWPASITGLRQLYTKDVLGFTRVQSTAYEPLYFANYLLMPIAIAFALFLSGRNIIRSGWLIVLFGLGLVNLILTVSRGGYLASLAILFIVGLFYLRRLLTTRNIIFFVVGVVLVGWVVIQALGIGGEFFTQEKFEEHISNAFYGASFDERMETFESAVQAWRQHPLIGIGFGGFGPYLADHPAYVPKDGWKIVNNEFIEILAENGFFGLFLFLLFLVFLIARSWRAIMVAGDRYSKAIMIALLAAFIGVLVQYQTFSTLYIMHVWFLIGLMVAVQNIIFNSQPESNQESSFQKEHK